VSVDRPVPAWARALDVLTVVAVLLFSVAAVFGAVTLYIAGARLSLRATHVLFLAVASTAIRHAAHPESPLHRRLGDARARLAANAPLSAAMAAIASRVAVLVAGYVAVLTIGVLPPATGLELSGDPLFNLPARFDAGWYGGIALDGYSFQGRFDRQQNLAFFPAMPLLMRTVGVAAGASQPTAPRPMRMARLLWAGVAIALIAFAWASAYLVRLARDTIGEPLAPTAAALMAAYPFAVFFSAPYTEALFVLGAIAAFYHFGRQQWQYAAAWGLVVGLTRPNGCFLTLPLLVLLAERVAKTEDRGPKTADRWAKSDERAAILKGVVAAAMPVLGMLAYSAYVHQVTGSWFGWARLHEAWGRTFAGVTPIVRALSSVSTAKFANEGMLRLIGDAPYDALNAAGVIFVLAMLWPVFRKLGLAYAIFVLINLAPPLLAGGLLSMGRLSSTLFPVFLALPAVLPRRAITPLVTVWAIGQGLVAALFFTWRPFY